jgi:thiopurine S-methyltransferase
VEQFFAENHLEASIHDSHMGRHYRAGNIEIICGDIFTLDATTLADCVGIYDRAALIALPAEMRADYTNHVYAKVSDQYRGLLLTLDYDQHQMDGPPFSVHRPEVEVLFGAHSTIRLVDQRDILAKEPKFAERGLTRLDTMVYELSRA